MPYRCVVYGCNKKTSPDNGKGLHKIPRSGNDRPECPRRREMGRWHCASQTSPLETIEAFKDLLFALYKRGFLPNVHRSSRASKANITKADGRRSWPVYHPKNSANTLNSGR